MSYLYWRIIDSVILLKMLHYLLVCGCVLGFSPVLVAFDVVHAISGTETGFSLDDIEAGGVIGNIIVGGTQRDRWG